VETYDADARPGDVVRGGDGHEWGVLAISRVPRLAVTLVRGARIVTGYPPPGTPCEIVARGEVPAGPGAEAAALEALLRGIGPVELLGETWER
jgi:hypothetical protein